MKKSIIFIVAILFSGMLVWNYNKNTTNFTTKVQAKESNQLASQQSIAKKIIRFHVLANSDSNEDQALKLKVRDKVLAYIAPKMSNSKSIDESREILKKYDKNINEIAESVIRENGYNYSVKTELANVDFPVKSYGAIVLPQGRYEAYRILIGSAKGHNWWCVMFPPLCFTDITKGNVEVEKTQDEMKSTLSKDEYQMVDNSQDANKDGNKKDDKKDDNKKENNQKIVVKFKIVDEVKKIGNSIQKDM
ncbi:stage II sporulation protein R [Clostridium sp.]|jgi:stage II sporulation protein R|uniref:stage II sporulation protein R n=1 Tax=Clostridium sp. TaxID=1506 RepID=UPI00258CA5B2|nr:stage II sporulation protein R [Clostridium sp.]MDF2505250.1 stage sporulation protein [Clostridium sp.]